MKCAAIAFSRPPPLQFNLKPKQDAKFEEEIRKEGGKNSIVDKVGTRKNQKLRYSSQKPIGCLSYI